MMWAIAYCNGFIWLKKKKSASRISFSTNNFKSKNYQNDVIAINSNQNLFTHLNKAHINNLEGSQPFEKAGPSNQPLNSKK